MPPTAAVMVPSSCTDATVPHRHLADGDCWVGASASAIACAASSFTWPQLPEGTLPDTEVSTNVVLHVNSQKLERFTLSLETTCCISNEVLVAIGCDSDGNGDLNAFVYTKFEEAEAAGEPEESEETEADDEMTEGETAENGEEELTDMVRDCYKEGTK